jgi:hypothetical protein
LFSPTHWLICDQAAALSPAGGGASAGMAEEKVTASDLPERAPMVEA